MATKSIISNSKLDAIAQAIKAKDATATIPMTADQMAAAIAAIPSGGGTDNLELLLQDRLTTYRVDSVNNIPGYAFYARRNLKDVTLGSSGRITIGEYAFASSGVDSLTIPNAWGLNILQYAFAYNSTIRTITAPIDTIGQRAFAQCTLLNSVKSTYTSAYGRLAVDMSAFYLCSNLTTLDVDCAPEFMYDPFSACGAMAAIVIRDTTKVATAQATSFEGIKTRLQAGTCLIYVPDALVDQYKQATNFAQFADAIKPLSEYTE